MTKTTTPSHLLVAVSLCALVGCSQNAGNEEHAGHMQEAPAAETKPAPQKQGALTIKGSDTMVILAQKWAQAFMDTHQGKVLQVSGGGSGTGIAALINGTADLANASRSMKDKEKVQLKERRGADAKESRVALDALAVYVHSGNPIESLSIPQLRKIFRGEAKNWKEFGGADKRIILYLSLIHI